MTGILQKGGFENDATGSNCETIVKLLPLPSKDVDHRHLTVCASEAGLAGWNVFDWHRHLGGLGGEGRDG